MEDSDLILTLDQLATWANESGFVDVEQFWTSLSAIVAMRQSQSRQAARKTAALLFSFPPERFKKWAEEEVEKRGVEILDIVVAAILSAQAKGDIDQKQAQSLIDAINRIRKSRRQ